jgi:hypothetical protein
MAPIATTGRVSNAARESALARHSTPGTARLGTTDGSLDRRIEQRIERLSAASLTWILEPGVEVPGGVGDAQVLPDELVSIAVLAEVRDRLTPAQTRTLAREEFGSIMARPHRFSPELPVA